MINLVYEEGVKLKEREGSYVLVFPAETAHEADSFLELAAVVCGLEYLDCEAAETAKMMRMEAAKFIGLEAMTRRDIELMMNEGLDDDDIDEDEGLREVIIVYDEAIGKIPYSYTDPVVDYDIHGDPALIRVECDETFILSLVKNRMIFVFERDEAGEYKNLEVLYDIDAEIEKHLMPFKEKAKTERIPLHKRLGE